MTNKEAFKLLADKMDRREIAIQEVKKLYEKTGRLPREHQHMKQYFNETPWREDPKVVRRIKKAARKAAKNSRKNNT